MKREELCFTMKDSLQRSLLHVFINQDLLLLLITISDQLHNVWVSNLRYEGNLNSGDEWKQAEYGKAAELLDGLPLFQILQSSFQMHFLTSSRPKPLRYGWSLCTPNHSLPLQATNLCWSYLWTILFVLNAEDALDSAEPFVWRSFVFSLLQNDSFHD